MKVTYTPSAVVIGARSLSANLARAKVSAEVLIAEEAQRIRQAGVTSWEEYRTLSRAGSRVAMGGFAKRLVWCMLVDSGQVGA